MIKEIVVDDEPLMIRKFIRLSEGIPDLDIIGCFETADEAYESALNNPPDVTFLDVSMPVTNGIVLAGRLKEVKKDIVIVFISAYEQYIRDSNQIGGDYYIIKPYTKDVLEIMMNKVRSLVTVQHKEIYIQMFGRFMIKKNGTPIALTGRAKEILALIATKRGKEISNEEIYSTIWEDRPYSNAHMSVYFNAVRRLNRALKKESIDNLVISTARGKMINTEICDCDYYNWLDQSSEKKERFEGEFLSEYSWAEYIHSEILNEEWKQYLKEMGLENESRK